MSRSFALTVALLAILASSHAFAGHEWTDGTMGPPQGRGYDTTMPQLPSPARHSIADPSVALCGDSEGDAKSNKNAASSSATAAGRNAVAATPSSRPLDNSKTGETCPNQVR